MSPSSVELTKANLESSLSPLLIWIAIIGCRLNRSTDKLVRIVNDLYCVFWLALNFGAYVHIFYTLNETVSKIVYGKSFFTPIKKSIYLDYTLYLINGLGVHLVLVLIIGRNWKGFWLSLIKLEKEVQFSDHFYRQLKVKCWIQVVYIIVLVVVNLINLLIVF